MFEVRNGEERATVYIYGTIGEGWTEEESNRARDFAQTLDGLSPKPVDIRIDSTGGDVYEGFAIASAIQRYPGETHAYVDGIAASAASYVALMADTVTMNDYSMFMIHNAWAICIGNRDDLRDIADRLEKIDGTIARVIAARSGMEPAEVESAMGAETWYRGDEALAAGMCDEVIETGQRLAACIDQECAMRYRNVPEGLLIDRAPEPEPAAEPAGEAPEDGASHALPTISDDEVKDAEVAILLGNRVYRKEQ